MNEFDMERALQAVFADVEGRFTCASLMRLDDHPCGGVWLELRCQEPGTIWIAACVLERQVDLFIGEHFQAEMWIGKTTDPREVVDYVRRLIEGATTVEVEERVWSIGRRVLYAKTIVQLPDGSKISSSGGPLLGILIPGRRATVRYSPYR